MARKNHPCVTVSVVRDAAGDGLEVRAVFTAYAIEHLSRDISADLIADSVAKVERRLLEYVREQVTKP